MVVAPEDLTLSNSQPYAYAERVASILCNTPGLEIHLCAWHQVCFDGIGFFIKGQALHVQPFSISLRHVTHVVPEALLFFPVSNPGLPGASRQEREAMLNWEALWRLAINEDRNMLAQRLLRTCATRGLVTNAHGDLSEFAFKDRLERLLLRYSQETGRTIARPETLVTAGQHLPEAIRAFHARGKACLVKPSNATRGEGIFIPNQGEISGIDPQEPFVVQEIVPNPLLIEGHKIDLRVVILFDSANRLIRPGFPILLVRTAGAPYAPGEMDSEITNTAQRARMGLPPGIRSLETYAAIEPALAAQIQQTVESFLRDYMESIAWYEHLNEAHESKHRIQLWGLDLQPYQTPDGLGITLLEVNVFPNLFICGPEGAPQVNTRLGNGLAMLLLDLNDGKKAGPSAEPVVKLTSALP